MFITDYDNVTGTVDCSGNNTRKDDEACTVDIKGGLEDLGATRDNGYGYLSGQPVVALKMNKVVLCSFSTIDQELWDT